MWLCKAVLCDDGQFACMAQGLDELHSCGLVHLDLKMNNARVSVQLCGAKVNVKLVLVDLGSARAFGSGEKATFASRAEIATI